MASKLRLDQLLVDRGLADSREKAKALVLAGSVFVAGQKAAKPGVPVPVEAALEVAARPPFVSRGGLKLAAALDQFGVSPEGRVCLDIGASTGGFTDCLLQRGAARVHAVDVGHGQLDWRLRQDPRVVVHEGLNARYLTPADIGEPASLITSDVSFISLTMILPPAAACLDSGGCFVVLVKPQFEAGREAVGKGGIVRDPAEHAAACHRVAAAFHDLGFRTAVMPSPILGAEGNKEFLMYADQN